MFEVHQHWDPLQICVVGRSYPPEFYSWISDSKTRRVFEQMAVQTEEDFQLLINQLKEFSVEIWRPEINLPYQEFDSVRCQYREPPMTPRDDMIMIGEKFYRKPCQSWHKFYQAVRAPNWPASVESISDLPQDIQQECTELHGWGNIIMSDFDPYRTVINEIQDNGNSTQLAPDACINGAAVIRLGQDLIVGVDEFPASATIKQLEQEFADYNLRITQSPGHMDGNYCPVCPGLIISHYDSDIYKPFFPDWQVVRVRPSLYRDVSWARYRKLTRNKWWLRNFDFDNDIIDTVEKHINNFVGCVDETAFEVNMLIVDPKNVIAFSYNKQVETALNQFGINLHVVPFRHRYFWDGGAHCVTLDIHRTGKKQKILRNPTHENSTKLH